MIKDRILALTNRVLIGRVYRRLFASDDGRIVLYHLMKTGYVTSSTYCPGDPHETAHREGMRRLVTSILKTVGEPEHKIQEFIEEAAYARTESRPE